MLNYKSMYLKLKERTNEALLIEDPEEMAYALWSAQKESIEIAEKEVANDQAEIELLKKKIGPDPRLRNKAKE